MFHLTIERVTEEDTVAFGDISQNTALEAGALVMDVGSTNWTR